ncbi:MAG: DUF4175 family protein [Pseudomonadota bacterium]
MLGFALLRAQAALIWERAAPVLAPGLAALGVYLALALFGVFNQLGDPFRLLTLVALTAAVIWLTHRALAGFTSPTRREAERRLEEDSRLKGRPFEALRDEKAAGDEPLWRAHWARMAARLEGAQARRPKSAWAELDPHGMRIALAMIVGLGVLYAGPSWSFRLSDAFAPRLLEAGGADAVVDLWIEPPDYTGRAPVFLAQRREAEAPQGSILAVRVAGYAGRVRLSGAEAEIERLPDGVRQMRARLEQSGPVTVGAGVFRRTIDITVLPDEPPRIALIDAPEGGRDGVLSVEFSAEDDYGVEQFAFEMSPLSDDAPSDATPENDAVWERFDLGPGDMAGSPERDYAARIDLAKHPLAGARAFIRMVAIDAAGQTAFSGPMAVVIPERVFLDPLARAVAFERKGVLEFQDDYSPLPDDIEPAATRPASEGGFLDDEPARRLERAPDEVRRLATALDAISDAPARYFDDPVVYLGLRTAMHEVRRARETDQLEHMPEDLWRIALRAELGVLADAEAALRAAERALADALARGAPQSELDGLFEAYQEAVDNYMRALAREAAEAGRFAEGGGGGGGQMSADALQELIDALREAAELGEGEEAQRALQQLAALLRNMQLQLSGGGQGSPMDEAMREALEELSDLIGDQRGLMDDTFQEEEGQNDEGRDQPGGAQPGQQDSETGEGDDGDLADRQGALRERLEALREQLGEAGLGEDGDGADELGQAERFMEEAQRALEEGDGQGALAAQDRALDSLRAGAADAAERMMAQSGEAAEGSDPLGRTGDGSALGGDQDIPDESERQRARDILEELRRRAGEGERSPEERDYIDRLLEQF